MLKTIVLVAAGLAAGFAVAYLTRERTQEAPAFADLPGASEPLGASAVQSAGNMPARIAKLEAALRTEIEQRTALEDRVAELDGTLAELRDGIGRAAATRDRSPDSGAGQNGAPPPAGGPPGGFGRGRGPDTSEQRVSRLVDAGFAPDRAAWIDKRTSELTMQAIQAQYQRRRGEPVDPALLGGGEQTLREEIGDAEYEQYLTALGRPTKVGVFNVIPSSPAEQAGLRAGDEIVSYAGTRVFDMRELNDLTVEGTPGQSVVLDVQRDGQNLQLVLPRGPIGIGGGPFNRRRP
jgi:hypothetical protein